VGLVVEDDVILGAGAKILCDNGVLRIGAASVIGQTPCCSKALAKMNFGRVSGEAGWDAGGVVNGPYSGFADLNGLGQMNE